MVTLRTDPDRKDSARVHLLASPEAFPEPAAHAAQRGVQIAWLIAGMVVVMMVSGLAHNH